MGAAGLVALAAAAAVGLRVEVQPLGRGESGTVVGVAVQVAPEDRERAGRRVHLKVSLVRGGATVDTHHTVLELAEDGSALLYREWPAGPGQVRVELTSLDGAARGGWVGEVVVTEEAVPFAAPAHAPPDAVALALAQPVTGTVRFLPPPRRGGLGAVQLELEAPPETDRVEFFANEQPLVERRRPPWTVSVNLGTVAARTVVKAVAWGRDGRFLGEDALVFNAPSSTIPVEILLGPPEPGGHRAVTVAVGRGGGVEVELRGDDRLLARWVRCPCVARVPQEVLASVRVLAALVQGPGGERGEAVRLLGAPGFVDEVRVEVVELPVVVLDERGVPVTGLTAADFEVFEDGQPVAVEGFGTTAELPLALGLVVDTSGSMAEPFPAVVRAVAGFASQLLRPGDSVFLATFDFDVRLQVPWTREAAAVAEALRTKVPEGGTSLYDAIVRALEEFRGRRGRTALVVLTDGDDTTSRTGWEVALRFVRTMRVPIFPVGFQIGRLDVGIRNRLQALARETGGQVVYAPKSGDLAEAYAAIAAQLRSQYLLSYRSPSRKGPEEFRSVRVVVRGEGRTARTITGYYPGR